MEGSEARGLRLRLEDVGGIQGIAEREGEAGDQVIGITGPALTSSTSTVLNINMLIITDFSVFMVWGKLKPWERAS